MKITRLKCGCKVTEEGYTYSECKYHETYCHFGIKGFKSDCKRKLKQSEYRYCKEHDEVMSEWGKESIGSFGGSDF